MAAKIPEIVINLSLLGGGLIDFDDVSVVVDGFWSSCRGQFLICRLYHMSDIQSQHWQDNVTG